MRHNPSNIPPLGGSSLSSQSDIGVLSTCLYNVSSTHLDVCSDAPSMSLSPRTLYAQYFDNPASSGRGASPGKRFKKDLNVLTGYDVSTSDKEFDALPIAVRRKYISTLERLWFAQNSRVTPPTISQQESSFRQEFCSGSSTQSSFSSHILESQFNQENLYTITQQNPSIAERRGKSINCIQTQKVPQIVQKPSKSRPASATLSLNSEPSLLDVVNHKVLSRKARGTIDIPWESASAVEATNSSTFLHSARGVNLLSPHGSNQRSFIYSPSLNNSPLPCTSGIDKFCETDDEVSEPKTDSDVCDKFRWMNESSNPDLRSSLDDYHANLDGVVIPSPSRPKRPSFRRQISINDMLFGRVNRFPEHPPRSEYPSNLNRRRSHSRKSTFANTRQLPTAPPKQSKHEAERHRVIKTHACSKSSSAHQKYSPKIRRSSSEFNDASREILTTSEPWRTKSRGMRRIPSVIDNSSLFECDASSGDPDSPLTPSLEGSFQTATSRKKKSQTSAYLSPTSSISNKSPPNFTQIGFTKPILMKKVDTQCSPSGVKEMTLKMTLTRPDLRSPDSELDSWQEIDVLYQSHSLSEISDEKNEIKGPLGGPDGWEPEEKEDSVVKRLWNKVTQPRKIL